MNYRTILNPDYNFIGLIFITLLIMILLFLNKNIKYTITLLGKISLTTGMIMLVLAFLLNFLLDIIFSYEYKIFIEVISKNVFQYCKNYSIICIIIGSIIYMYSKIFWKEQQIR